MIKDIVIRLRHAHWPNIPDALEAADAIARLRADCAKLETAHGQLQKVIDRLTANLAAERERAKEYRNAWLRYMDARVEALRERDAALAALKPFAEAAKNFDGMNINNEEEWFAYSGQSRFEGQKGAITVGDLRRARATIDSVLKGGDHD